MDDVYFKRQRLSVLLRKFVDAPGQLVAQVLARAGALFLAALAVLVLLHVDSRRDVYGPRVRRHAERAEAAVLNALWHVRAWDASLEEEDLR
jgi:hypothetical protein